MDEFRMAAVQAAPVFFDRQRSLEKAVDLIADCARRGAGVAAFGESWIPGYPFFSLMPPIPLWAEASAAYAANAVTVPGPEVEALCAAAKAGNIDVVIGVAELETQSRGTIYATLLFIGREGRLLGRHRKLKPTAGERTIWGEGDAAGLLPHERVFGRLSGLNCWEHNMGLPGYALAAQGTDVHVAAWPGGDLPTPPEPSPAMTRQTLLSRAFASMAASYVIAVGGTGQRTDMPPEFVPLMPYEAPGGSIIVDPRGEIIAGPAEGETILIAAGSRRHLAAAKAAVDPGGHYSRPDIFRLEVNRRPLPRIHFVDGEDSAP